jgi:hypothetical protein
MKKFRNTILVITITFFLSLSFTSIAQPPPPPNSGSNNDENALNGDGGGAPVGGGLFILLGLGAAYGGRKLYQLRHENLEE